MLYLRWGGGLILQDSSNNAVHQSTEIREYIDLGAKSAETPSDTTLTTSSTWKSAFPDRNFRVVVWSLYNTGTYTDAQDDINLTQAQINGGSTGIQTRTVLNVSGKSIISLAGVEHFLALKDINANVNLLTSVDFTKNLALETLQLGNNKLTEIDVSANINLKIFYCYNNELTAVDISRNTALEHFNCVINRISSIDVSKNVNLIGLSVRQNRITSIDVSKNLALKQLEVHTNRLTAIDISKNVLLTTFYCHNNFITELDVSTAPGLTALRFASNPLANVTGLEQLENLENLYAERTNIQHLNIHHLAKSKITDLRFNNTLVRDFDFTGFTSLVRAFITTSKNFLSNPSFIELRISGTRTVEESDLVSIQPHSSTDLIWTNGFFQLLPAENNKYAMAVARIDSELEMQYIVTTPFSLSEGAIIDQEGNVVVGANALDIDDDTRTIIKAGPNTIITPNGTLEIENEVVIDGGDITFTGDALFIKTGLDAEGRPSIDAGGTIKIEGNTETTIDPVTWTRTTQGPFSTTLPNGDVIIYTGEAVLDKEGKLVSTNDPYIIVKSDLSSRIGTDDESRTVVPGVSTLVIPDGTEFSLLDGGAINDDKSIEITPKDSVELPNGNISIFPEGGRINPDGSTTSNGFTITIDKDDVLYIGHNKDGSTTVPENTIVTTPTGEDYVLPQGGITLTDDTIKLDNGGSVVTPNDKTVDFPNGGIFDTLTGKATPSANVEFDNGNIIKLPQGGTINDDQSVNIGNNHGATLPNNDEIILPEGGRIDSDGNITTTGPIVRVPNGTEGEATSNPDGTINVPKGTEITDKDGNKTIVEEKSVYDPITGLITPINQGTGTTDPAGSGLVIGLSVVMGVIILAAVIYTVFLAKKSKEDKE